MICYCITDHSTLLPKACIVTPFGSIDGEIYWTIGGMCHGPYIKPTTSIPLVTIGPRRIEEGMTIHIFAFYA